MQEIEAGLIPGPGRSPEGGHGNPLQYSCLENPMDRGAWWATVHRVTKNWTRLKQLSTRVHACITSVRMLNRTHGEADCLENLGKPPGEGSINRVSDLFNRFSFNTCMWQEQCKTLIYKELGTKRVVFGRQLTINSP